MRQPDSVLHTAWRNREGAAFARAELLACPPEPLGRRRRSTAFTLVELLVVMAIISVLMALLMPALRTTMESSRAMGCRANLRQVGAGGHLYAQDHNGRLPSQRVWWQATRGEERAMHRHLGLPSVDRWADWPETFFDTVLTCPSAQRFPGPMGRTSNACYNRTYQLNTHMAGSIKPRDTDTHNVWERRRRELRAPEFVHRVPDPSGAAFFFDGFDTTAREPGEPRQYLFSAEASQFRFRDRYTTSSNRAPRYFAHGPGPSRGSHVIEDDDVIQVVFVDGHVRPLERRQTEAYAENWTEAAFFGQ